MGRSQAKTHLSRGLEGGGTAYPTLHMINITTNINSLPLLGPVHGLGLDVLHGDDVGEGDRGVHGHNEVCHNHDENDI